MWRKMELKNDNEMGAWNGLMDVIFLGDMVGEKWWWKMDMVDGDMMRWKWMNELCPMPHHYSYV